MADVALRRPVSPLPPAPGSGHEKRFSWGYKFHAREKKRPSTASRAIPSLRLHQPHRKQTDRVHRRSYSSQNQNDCPYHNTDGGRLGRGSVRTTIAQNPPISSVPAAYRKSELHVDRNNRLGADWRKLSKPLLDLVLDHLRDLHLSRSSTSCTTCYLRDLSALSQTCRSFSLPAQHRLYDSIQVVGRDSVHQLRRFGVKHGTRLIFLRRTLRANPRVAALVRRLHVPDPIIPWFLPGPDEVPNPDYEEYVSILASVVMSCPNLESFTGFYAFYNHTFDRLTHALSTRPRLASHIWIVAENAEISKRARHRLPPGLLSPAQHREFVSYHANWSRLRTLLLCSPGSAGVLEEHILLETVHSLPSLRNLGLSSFDADDVNDGTLIALPSTLKALRLEENRGITDAGLARWAASFVPSRLERLSLIHQGITSIVTISKILAGLYRLRRFTILQSDVSPALPPSNAVVCQPFLASIRLQFLHWDIADPAAAQKFARGSGDRHRRGSTRKLTANEHLALSISHHGFPALRYLRAPRDVSPPGALQFVCWQPEKANLLRPEDVFLMKSGQSPAVSSNSLQAARVRAQRLINDEEAKAAVKKKHGKDVKSVAAVAQSYSTPSAPPRVPAVATATATARPTTPVLHPRLTPCSTPRSTPRTARNTPVGQRQARDDEDLSASSSRSSNPSSSTTTATTNSTATTNDTSGSEDAPLHSTPKHVTQSPKIAREIDQEGYRIGEGWDKEVIVVSPSSKREMIYQNYDEQRGRSENYLPASKIPTRTHTLMPKGDGCTSDQPINVDTRNEPGCDLADLKRRAATRSRRNSRPSSANPKAAVEATVVAAVVAATNINGTVNGGQPATSPRTPRRSSLLQTDSLPPPPPKPRFWLHPDIPGRDANGGLVGWAELLRVTERQRAGQSWEPENQDRSRARDAQGSAKKVVRVVTPTTSTSSVGTSSKSTRASSVTEEADEGWIKDGCDGGWNNKSRGGGGTWNGVGGRPSSDEASYLGGGGGGGGAMRGRRTEAVAARVSASISKRFSFAGINEIGSRIRSRSRSRSRNRDGGGGREEDSARDIGVVGSMSRSGSMSRGSSIDSSSNSSFTSSMPAWQHTFRERGRGQREGRDVALAAELVFF